MVQSAPQLLSVDEFINWYGDRDRHELIDGELINMESTGLHEQVATMIGRKLNVEIDRQAELRLTAKQIFAAAH